MVKFVNIYISNFTQGIVQDWDDLVLLWRYCYDNLHVNAAEKPLLITEAPLNPPKQRETMVQLLFESLYVLCSIISGWSMVQYCLNHCMYYVL